MRNKTVLLIGLILLALSALTPAFCEEQKVDPKLDPWLKTAMLGRYLPSTEDWSQVVAKAKTEGKVVIYSSTSRIQKVKDLFQKTYPGVTLEAYDMETLQIHEKFSREYQSGIYNVDVIMNDSTPQMYEFWQKGLIFRYVPGRVAAKVPEFFKDWLLTQRYGPGQVVFYNPTYWKTKPPVSNLWDFTKPEWKGKIAIADPTQHGDTLAALTLLTEPDNAALLGKAYEKAYGKPISVSGFVNAGYMYLSMLAKNNVIIVKSDDNVMELVGAKGQAGMPPFGLFITMSKLRQIAEKGLDLAVLAPGVLDPFEELGQPPTSDLVGSVIGIAANAQHPFAARLLIDFLMGDEKGDGGFAPWHVIGNWSTRTDVKSAEGDLQDRSVLRSMPGKPSIKWVAENQPKVRDFWLTQVF